MIHPRKQTVYYIKSHVYTENEIRGIKQPSPDLEDNDDLIICTELRTTKNRLFTVLINNFMEQLYTLKTGSQIAIFSILTPEQAKYIKPINAAPLRHLLETNHDDAIQYVGDLLKEPQSKKIYWNMFVSHASGTRWWNPMLTYLCHKHRPFACFNLQRPFDWRRRSLKHANCLCGLCCGVL